MSIDESIGTMLAPLAERYVVSFGGEDQKVKDFLVKDWVQVHLLELVYCSLSGTEEFPKIEKLQQVEKDRLWKTVTGWAKEKDKAEKIRICRALHLIETFQQKKVNP